MANYSPNESTASPSVHFDIRERSNDTYLLTSKEKATKVQDQVLHEIFDRKLNKFEVKSLDATILDIMLLNALFLKFGKLDAK